MFQEIELKSPIFSIYIIEDKLIVAVGGGNKKYGVKNKIIIYQLHPGYIGQVLIEKELDENPQYIEGIPSKKIFCYISNNKIIFNSLSNDNKSFNELYKLTINPEDILLNCYTIKEDLLATGDDNGSLKLFKINFNVNDIASINEIGSNEDAHYKGINKIAFSFRNKNIFLITASGDGTCKIFDISNSSEKTLIKMISFFSFRESISEFANHFMRDLIYIEDKHFAYTIQSPRKGKSYLTKWDLNNVNCVKPIETINISNEPCNSFDLTEDKKYFGIIDVEGRTIYVDVKNMKITGSKKIEEVMLNCCKFYKNYLITGSIATFLRINKLSTSFSSSFIKFIFYTCLILGIFYYIYLKKNNLINIDI